ncbi:MAG: helix-hairpin-helix domain-containing protein [Gemmatimonadetes bacterium]|nr:helix-hairpin-helix domain-containing protein [Gemmatimonadota bacterium]
MECYHWQARGHVRARCLFHTGRMPSRPDRLHVALGVLLVLGIGFRLVRRDPGAGPAAEVSMRTQRDAPRRSQTVVSRRAPTEGIASAAPRRRPADTLAAMRAEVSAPGSLPAERVVRDAARAGQLARPRVDPSAASLEELTRLPGIGPAMARRIVEEREARGKFASLEDLHRVRGIGPAMSARLAPYVTFGDNGRPSVVTSGAEGSVRNGARKSRRAVRRPSSD